MDRERRALAVVGAGLLLVAGTLAVGAVAGQSWSPAAEGDGDRRTLVGSQSTAGGWNDAGAVYALDGEEIAWRTDSAASYFEVTRLDDGRVLAAFASAPTTEDCGRYEEPCVQTGYRVIDPTGAGDPEIESEYALPMKSIDYREVHGVDAAGDGSVVVADMAHERILTVREGAITWQWNASTFYDAPEDPTERDWLHINDVDAINDTHFLVSVRNANQALVLERGEGVAEVINADDGGSDDTCAVARRTFTWMADTDGDGDVRCGDPDVMYNQHNPQWLGDGAILVADSENHRVVELHRDETTGEWEPAWTLTEAQGVELTWPRDADRLPNGNTLVTDTQNGRLVEVAADGTTVWSVEAEHLPYEADRLPAGESVGATRYGTAGSDGEAREEVPVLTTVLLALRGQFAAVPVWFREAHLLASVVGLAVALVGSVDLALARWS